MKAEIEAGLRALIGQPLIGSHRAVDLESFHFGVADQPSTNRGKSGLRTRYHLHVQCPWRIVEAGAIVTGYDDHGEPNSALGDSRDLARGNLGQTLREELLEAFYLERKDDPRRVVAIEATDVGDLRVIFDGGCVLEAFPDMSSSHAAFTDKYTVAEHWRFIDVLGDHLVVGRDGLDIQPLVEDPPPVP